MPTNEERREVAARLRDIGVKTWHTSWHELYAIKDACGCYTWQDCQDVELKDRLADLIEPDPEITCEFDSQVCGKRRCKRCGAFVSVDSVWDCSGCIPAKYCPNCGAKVISNAR